MNLVFRPLLLAGALLLAACDTRFDADLAADALDNADRVQLAIAGIELRKSEGSSDRVTRNQRALPDLLLFQDDVLFELISSAELDESRYTGVRLITDAEDSFVDPADGGAIIDIVDVDDAAPWAEVDFRVEEDERVAIALVLDLRLSLSLDEDAREYSLNPLLRAVREGDAAEVSGLVAASRVSGNDCAGGRAVYAFRGFDVEPDERDGSGVEPFASAPLRASGSGFSYRLRLMPAGRYTLALTCDGERENGLSRADLDVTFRDEQNVELDEGEVLRNADFR